MSFFTVIFLNYGLPLHILRDVYFTLRSFIRRCGDLVRYRRATRDMDALYPDATRADLDRNGDLTCIICREEMVPKEPVVPQAPAANGQGPQPTPTQPVPTPARSGPNETPKKLSCGHVFHFHCLRSWLERQQSCPTW
jgi:E3 ubiquitin-protein ligase synoviolin